MSKYIGKKSILIGDDILLRDTLEGSTESISDFFRKEIGNHYVLDSGKGLYFRTMKSQRIRTDILQSPLVQPNTPDVIMTPVSETSTGEEVHDVEVIFNVIPKLEEVLPETVNEYGTSIYDRLPGQDVDGMSVEYSPPVEDDPYASGIAIPGAQAPTDPSAPLPAGLQGVQGPVMFRDGNRTDTIPQGDIPTVNIPEIAENTLPENIDNIYPTEEVGELDKYETSLTDSIGEVYSDFNIEFNKPYDYDELRKIDGINNPLSCNVEGGYNFYFKQFEDKYYNDNVKEVNLPNLYDMYADNTLGGNLLANSNIETILSNDIEFGRYKNVTINFNEDNDIKNWNQFASSAFTMPSQVTVELGMEPSSVSDFMNDSMINNVFLIDYTSDYLNQYNNFTELDFNEQISSLYIDTESGEETSQIKRSDHRLKMYDFMEWVDRVVDVSNGVDEETQRQIYHDLTMFDVYDNGLEVIDGVDELEDSDSLQMYFVTALLSMFKSKINNLVNETRRGYDDIFSGDTAYQETLLYVVSKINTRNDQVIQNYIFFNNNDNEIIKYVDSQVKYSKEYRYEVKAHKVVFGTDYSYSDVVRQSNSVKFKVTTTPNVKIMEVPFYEKSISIFDSPPIYPEVQIHAYRDRNDRVLIELNRGIGEIFTAPISITEDDELMFEQLQTSKNSVDGLIKFKSDDVPEYFEIYRIDFEPKTYKDFDGHLLTRVNTKVQTGHNEFLTSASGSFVDVVGENKTHYYTFRTVDNHGNVSNPTNIYLVRLITHGDRVKPVIKVYDIDYFINQLDDYKTRELGLRRFIMIKPTIQQEIIDPELSGFEDALSVDEIDQDTGYRFGVAKQSVWGKSYKLRVKSKSTGRFIDVGFRFINKPKEENQ